jgi:hypothetical protein
MLLTESAHLSNALILKPCNACAKRVFVFRDLFLLMVEVINMKAAKRKK